MIIDFHTHVFPSFFRDMKGPLSGEPGFMSIYNSPKAKLVGVRQLINNMDNEGIKRSVIFGFPWDNYENFKRHNDYIIEAVTRYPERLIGFSCFSPLSKDGARESERCLRSGLSGVGELALYRTGISSELFNALGEVMNMCREFDVPLLLHINEPVGHEYPGKVPVDLGQVYAFIKAYPFNKIVLAHWGGGLFFYTIMKNEVKDALKNVWFDTAASPFLYTPDVYRIAVESTDPEKILFGSDYPLIKPQRYFNEMLSAGISDSAIMQIKGLNAVELLRLKA